MACNSTPQPTAVKNDSVLHEAAMSPFTNRNLAGYFADTIPCADCPGIVMRLDLKNDSSFILEQEYLGRKDSSRLFYQLGNWTVVDSILHLSEITEGPKQFKILQPDEIRILDNEGAIITDTRLNYALHRQPGSFTAKKDILVHGMFALTANGALLKICSLEKDFPVTFAAAMQNMQAQYRKLKKADGERIFTEVEGSFENQPSKEAGKTTEVFAIKKFIRFTPGEKCRE